jgi:WhiB family transcriptional regulator, redox-sensing transcriptional regulator
VQDVESPAQLAPPGRRDPMDVVIAKAARCADPRSTYSPLFFSENPAEAARAKAICARCTVRCLCLARALQRGEPFGVWGGEFIVDGEVVAVRRGRGRPRKVALPTTVDEITGEPAFVA